MLNNSQYKNLVVHCPQKWMKEEISYFLSDHINNSFRIDDKEFVYFHIHNLTATFFAESHNPYNKEEREIIPYQYFRYYLEQFKNQ